MFRSQSVSALGDRLMLAANSGSASHSHTAYDMLEKQLRDDGWVVGETLSLADCAAAPALFYAYATHPFGGSRPRLAAYFDRLRMRPSVARVIAEAGPYLENFRLRDALPERFVTGAPT